MTVHIVGTCGNCGGPVEIPQVWMGIYPPTPTCRSCGATPRAAHGPTLPMNPPRERSDIRAVIETLEDLQKSDSRQERQRG